MRDLSSEPNGDEALFRELAGVVQASGVAPVALLTSDAIEGYEILGEVRRGGQGTVYVARQVTTNRKVALKVLDPGLETSARERLRFEREVDLASRLCHPGVVRVYESGETDGRRWYTMEFAEGERLDEYLRDPALERDARLALFEQIAAAVAYAQRCGVIHRDLKPANILVDANGAPRIIDFGLAFAPAGDTSPRLTATGEFLGTLDYASPEQVRGEVVDTRTDVHALGILLFETLTGHRPWDTSGAVADVLHRIEHDAPADPYSLSTEVDGELRVILMTALAKDPAQRYASADALLRDLRHYTAGEPLEARPQTTAYVLRKALIRNRFAVCASAAVLVLLAGATFAIVRQQWRADSQREQADLARQLMKDVVGAGGAMNDDAARLAVLEDTARRLESGLGAAPDVQAALQLALGESHAARLRHAEAEDHLRRAVARFREAGDGAGIARSLAGLAEVLADRGEPEAVEAAEEALAWQRSRAGADDPSVAAAERLLARTLLARLPERDEDEVRAGELLDRALASLRADRGEQDPEVAATQVLRARLAPAGDVQLEMYASALAVLERRPGETPRTIECLDGYSRALAAAGRLDEADELLRRSARLTRQTYGERHTVDHLRRRSRLEQERGHLEAAERLARTAVSTEIDGWLERRPAQEPALITLSVRMRAEDPAPYVEAFAMLRELRSNGDFVLSSWMNGIARLLALLGREGEADALLEESLNIYCRVYGRDCPTRMRTLYQLAEGRAARERFAEAETHLDEIIAALERTGAEETAFTRRVRALLSDVRGRRTGLAR